MNRFLKNLLLFIIILIIFVEIGLIAVSQYSKKFLTELIYYKTNKIVSIKSINGGFFSPVVLQGIETENLKIAQINTCATYYELIKTGIKQIEINGIYVKLSEKNPGITKKFNVEDIKKYYDRFITEFQPFSNIDYDFRNIFITNADWNLNIHHIFYKKSKKNINILAITINFEDNQITIPALVFPIKQKTEDRVIIQVKGKFKDYIFNENVEIKQTNIDIKGFFFTPVLERTASKIINKILINSDTVSLQLTADKIRINKKENTIFLNTGFLINEKKLKNSFLKIENNTQKITSVFDADMKNNVIYFKTDDLKILFKKIHKQIKINLDADYSIKDKSFNIKLNDDKIFNITAHIQNNNFSGDIRLIKDKTHIKRYCRLFELKDLVFLDWIKQPGINAHFEIADNNLLKIKTNINNTDIKINYKAHSDELSAWVQNPNYKAEAKTILNFKAIQNEQKIENVFLKIKNKDSIDFKTQKIKDAAVTALFNIDFKNKQSFIKKIDIKADDINFRQNSVLINFKDINNIILKSDYFNVDLKNFDTLKLDINLKDKQITYKNNDVQIKQLGIKGNIKIKDFKEKNLLKNLTGAVTIKTNFKIADNHIRTHLKISKDNLKLIYFKLRNKDNRLLLSGRIDDVFKQTKKYNLNLIVSMDKDNENRFYLDSGLKGEMASGDEPFINGILHTKRGYLIDKKIDFDLRFQYKHNILFLDTLEENSLTGLKGAVYFKKMDDIKIEHIQLNLSEIPAIKINGIIKKEKINLEGEMYNDILRLIPLYVKEIKNINGEFKGKFKITGKPEKPVASAQIDLKKIKIVPNGFIPANIENVSGKIILDKNRLKINDFSGRINENGFIRIHTPDFIDSKYIDLSIEANEVPLNVPGIKLYGIGKASVSIKGPFTKPEISGTAYLKNASFTYPPVAGVNTNGVGNKPEFFNFLNWNVKLIAENNVRYFRDEVDGEVIENSYLDFLGKGETFRAEGVMLVKRGYVYYFGVPFKVMDAKVVFKGEQLPYVYGMGEATVGGHTIQLIHAGKLFESKIKLFDLTDSTMDEEEILDLINTGIGKREKTYTIQTFSQEEKIASTIGAKLAKKYLEPIERSIEQSFAVSFKINPYLTTAVNNYSYYSGYSKVSFGKYLDDDIYLSYEGFVGSERYKTYSSRVLTEIKLNPKYTLDIEFNNFEREKGDEEVKLLFLRKLRF